MCEVILVKVQCVTVKLLIFFIINNHKKYAKYFQNECCSITSIRSVMCEVILVKVQCVTVKLLILFHNNIIKNMPKQLFSK